MALRDVVVQATLNEMQGDEVYELWLDRGGVGAWELESSGAVGGGPTQDFAVNSLEEGVLHVVQLRTQRESRYRSDYLSEDPDDWPAASRLEFYPGSAPPAAPTMGATEWERTATASERVHVTVTPNASHLDLDIELLRNGVAVATAEAPFAGTPIEIDDVDPPGEVTHTYTARHVSPPLYGNLSGSAQQYVGPDAPVGFQQTLPVLWYQYVVEWTMGVSGAVTRIQDAYLCYTVFAERDVTAVDEETATETVEKESSASEAGGEPEEGIAVRARHELTQFGTTDVSGWVTTVCDVRIAADETANNSCP